MSLAVGAVSAGTAVTAVAVLLLAAGIAASVTPAVPGPLVSLLGVYVYWVGTGFAKPGPLLLVLVTVACVLTFGAGLVAEVVAARVGGAPTWVVALGVGVGIALVFVVGLVGLLVGLVGTVFVVELVRRRSLRGSLTAVAVVVVASFASTVVQIAVTTGVFVTMLAVMFL